MNSLNYKYLKSNPELLMFVRQNPIWYRYLSRDSNRIHTLVEEANRFYGKTFPQRIEKVNNQIQTIGMLLQFAEMMKD